MTTDIRLPQMFVLQRTVTRSLGAILVCALGVLGGACGSPSEPAPGPYPAVGTWSGSVTDKAAGAGTMRVVLQYSSAQQTIAGPFTMTFTDGMVSGDLVGPAMAGEISETISCGGRSALGFVTMTPAGSRMQGSYAVLNDNCSPITQGSLDLTKQP